MTPAKPTLLSLSLHARAVNKAFHRAHIASICGRTAAAEAAWQSGRARLVALCVEAGVSGAEVVAERERGG